MKVTPLMRSAYFNATGRYDTEDEIFKWYFDLSKESQFDEVIESTNPHGIEVKEIQEDRMNDYGEIVMKTALIITISLLFLGCTNPKDAESALQSQGFSDVEITGYNFFACGIGDFYQTGFTATNVNGQKVEGTVCSGLLFKNSTIRW